MSPSRAAACLLVTVLVVGALHAAGLLSLRAPQPRPGATVERDRFLARTGRAAIGDRVEAVLLLDPEDRPYLHELPGDGRPVVIYFWSCLCRCVRDCEERIVALLERYPEERVHFFAVDSNPGDSAFDIHKLRTAMDSPYEVFRDVQGATARHLGVDASASVAVLDGRGRLRYRGAIDDDLYDPTVSYVHEALEAILAQRPLERTSAPSYGCRYPVEAPASGRR